MNFLPPRSRRHPVFYQLRWVTAQAPTSKRKPDLPLPEMIHAAFWRDLRALPGTLQNSRMQPVAIGAFNWVADRDQVVRRIALVFTLNQSFVPSLAVEALRVAQGATTYVLKASNASGETAFGQSTGLNHIRIGDVEVPTDAGGGVYLKFRHFNKKAYIPAWKVWREKCRKKRSRAGSSLSGPALLACSTYAPPLLMQRYPESIFMRSCSSIY